MDDLVEFLAEGSHRGWMKEKRRQGFTDHPFNTVGAINGPEGHICGTCVWPARRHHADMLPYAELPDHIKEYDRVTVRGVLAGIDEAGYDVVKRPVPA